MKIQQFVTFHSVLHSIYIFVKMGGGGGWMGRGTPIRLTLQNYHNYLLWHDKTKDGHEDERSTLTHYPLVLIEILLTYPSPNPDLLSVDWCWVRGRVGRCAVAPNADTDPQFFFVLTCNANESRNNASYKNINKELVLIFQIAKEKKKTCLDSVRMWLAI